jgi:tetratricopeptide (TPR) repeat protein
MPAVNKMAGAYKNALAESPNNQELNNSLAMCYLKLKLYDKALPAFEKALAEAILALPNRPTASPEQVRRVSWDGLCNTYCNLWNH